MEYLVSLIGVVIGWFLNQLTHIFKGKKEDNRIRKEVLFYLLEIRFKLPKLDAYSIINELELETDTKMPFLKRIPPLRQQILKASIIATQQVIDDQRTEFETVQNDLAASISKLCSVDPFIAFELSGCTKTIQHSKVFEIYSTEISNLFDEEIFHKAKNMMEEKDSNVLSEILNNIECYAREIAEKIGKRSLKETNEIIEEIKSKKVENDKSVDDELQKVIKAMSGMSLSELDTTIANATEEELQEFIHQLEIGGR